MPITEICTVVKDKGKTAIVEIKRTQKCDGCNACAFNKRDFVRIPAIKDIDCVEGDRVCVEMPEKEISIAPLFLFVIPIVLTLVAVILCKNLAIWWQIPIIAGFLTAGLVILYTVDKLFRRKRKYMPVIRKRTEKGEEDGRPQVD